MQKHEFFITSQNVKMPKIIYGTAWKKEKTTELVIKAIKTGFKGIDTACQPKHYSEPLVGEALKALNAEGISRDTLFLQTKFTPINGQDPHDIPYDKGAKLEDQIEQSINVSLKNLKTDYLDSLVIHSPLGSKELNLRAWKVFEKHFHNGNVKQLGISNCYDLFILKDLYINAEIKPSVIQNRFYNSTNYDKDLRKWCNDNNIIYQSFWTLTANPHILQNNMILEIANNYSKTSSQILFRYLTQNNIAPLTGTTSEKHMLDDLDIFNFELSKNELEKMDSLF